MILILIISIIILFYILSIKDIISLFYWNEVYKNIDKNSTICSNNKRDDDKKYSFNYIYLFNMIKYINKNSNLHNNFIGIAVSIGIFLLLIFIAMIFYGLSNPNKFPIIMIYSILCILHIIIFAIIFGLLGTKLKNFENYLITDQDTKNVFIKDKIIDKDDVKTINDTIIRSDIKDSYIIRKNNMSKYESVLKSEIKELERYVFVIVILIGFLLLFVMHIIKKIYGDNNYYILLSFIFLSFIIINVFYYIYIMNQ